MIDPTFKNAKILIVDDKEANIDVLAGLLEIQGFENVKSTTDSRRVVELFSSFHPDLILLDLMMPHLNGYQVMEQLKSLIPENVYLPILVLTADITTVAKQQALAGGAKDFLSKPFDLIEVTLRINNLLFARYLHQQSLKQNEILEEKVRERTAELSSANAELLAAKEKAVESDMLKRNFLNNISHEIRTPSNGVLGFLELLQDRNLTSSEREEYVSIFNHSALRLIKTINDIVEISQIQSGLISLNITETDIRQLSTAVFDRLKNGAADKGLDFRLNHSLPDDFGCVLTDRNKLRSVLMHLIDNAIKFTKSGSVKVDISKSDEFLLFSIADTGIGIFEKHHATIFDRFRQVDGSDTREYEGSGIWLSIAKFHVEMLGGKIWLDSHPGNGSTFYFTIPYKTTN